MGEILLYGASGHAKVILDAIKLSEPNEIILIDDNESLDMLGEYKVGQYNPSTMSGYEKVIISVGDNRLRKEIANRLNSTYTNIIHPSAIMAKSVIKGIGNFIAAGAVINPDTSLGNHVIINTSATVDHDCIIKDFVHIAPNATLCGGVRIGEGTLVGAGATLIPNVQVGQWVTIGAGTVVTQNVPDYAVVVGNPGRMIKKNEAK